MRQLVFIIILILLFFSVLRVFETLKKKEHKKVEATIIDNQSAIYYCIKNKEK